LALAAFTTGACSSGDDDTGAGGTGGMGSGGTGTAGMGMAGATPRPAGPACADIPALATGSSDFKVTVTGFASCSPIPAQHTCDAKPFPQGSSPQISWTPGPTGTKSYALVFKDISILSVTEPTASSFNMGFHYTIWDIPPATSMLVAEMKGGHLSPDVTGARQWSNFNDYGWFGPCPNYDPTMPTDFNDSYAFVLYALSVDKAVVPAPKDKYSSVRLMDDYFQTVALATAEYRGTSNAHSSGVPAGILPPTAMPPCPTVGDPPAAGCVAGP
jgi:phosphatidylethanolamine-binding protein (PEBP) family uncharacterized protein